MSGRDLDVYLTQNILADSCSRIDVRKGKTYLNRFVARIMDHECQYTSGTREDSAKSERKVRK